MSRISILNASAEDFALEIVSSAPVNGSVGDNENGRLVKYGTHIYVWCDHQGIWAKFANVSDFTSLETRLSQQEDANDADVLSLEGIDSSLESRISSEEVARASAITSANARAVAIEGSLESRLSTEEVAREADVDAEESRALIAEASVDAKLSTAKSDRIAAVDSLQTRAEAAETSLETRLSVEEFANWSATLYDGTVPISDEEYLRGAMDSAIAADIASATADRIAGDASLETAISTEEARISAILHASTADKDSFAEIVTHINAIDLAHDTQTSTEIASLAADIVSMESSLEGIDDSLELRLSNEEDAMASGDASLTTRLATEEGAMASGDASLTTRLASEESARLAADNSLGGRMGVEEVAMASDDASIESRLSTEEDAMAAGDLSLETLLSGDASDRASDDSSIETRMSEEESAMLSAVASEEAERIAGDASIELLISAEEVARAAADVSLTTRMSNEEDAMVAADASLDLRLSSEEANEVADKGSLETRLSNEEDAMSAGDSSVETRFSNEVSTEKSRIDAILDSADADKDTFVELVSFITEFDVDADDQLASYQVVIDSRISAEESNMAAGDASLEAELSSKIVERQSAITSLETKHSGEISSLAESIDSVEVREENRHLRVDFGGTTPVTSFTVSGSQFPAGFKMDEHGMVQVFQDMGSSKFRHLVAPVEIDMSSGNVTVQLGSTAKSGFAVFYMFADDEGEVSSPSTASAFQLGGYDASEVYSQTSPTTDQIGYTIYMKDYVNLDQSGYPTSIHSMGYDLGAGAETKWYYKPDGNSTYSSYTYTFQGYESGYGGDDFSASSMTGLSEGAEVALYAELYDASGNLVATAGSASAPFYVNAPAAWTMSSYASGITVSPGTADHGQTVDVTVTVDLATANVYSSYLELSGNNDSYNYGWNGYDTMWVAQASSGSPSSYEQDLINGFNNNLYNPNSYASASFPNSTLPAAGTYNFNVVATNGTAPSSPTTFQITIIVA